MGQVEMIGRHQLTMVQKPFSLVKLLGGCSREQIGENKEFQDKRNSWLIFMEGKILTQQGNCVGCKKKAEISYSKYIMQKQVIKTPCGSVLPLHFLSN